MFWDYNHLVGNVGIQNIFARTRYQAVLQNNYIAYHTKQDKTDTGHKIRTIDYLNESFQRVFLNEQEQCIDEHMTKFKGYSWFLS